MHVKVIITEKCQTCYKLNPGMPVQAQVLSKKKNIFYDKLKDIIGSEREFYTTIMGDCNGIIRYVGKRNNDEVCLKTSW